MKAILKTTEESNDKIDHGILYDFYYDDEDDFYLIINGEKIHECSTAFNFV